MSNIQKKKVREIAAEVSQHSESHPEVSKLGGFLNYVRSELNRSISEFPPKLLVAAFHQFTVNRQQVAI